MYVCIICFPMIKLKRNVAPEQYISDNRETNDKRNPSYTLSTMNNIFHDKVIFKKNFLLSNSGIRHQPTFRTARIGAYNCSNH